MYNVLFFSPLKTKSTKVPFLSMSTGSIINNISNRIETETISISILLQIEIISKIRKLCKKFTIFTKRKN